MEFKEIILGQGGIAIIVGFLVQGCKNAGMPSKYSFILSANLGGCFAAMATIAVSGLSVENVILGFMGGIISGAVASGFWSGTKSLIEK